MHAGDTIVAVSSSPGRSRRAMIRLSGSESSAIVQKLTGEAVPGARMLSRRRLVELALPILVVRFVSPVSFTGEDVVEFQLPGNAALLDRVLHCALEAGARLAEPGEFTFRAMRNGKLDLTQAEGVAATISAVSDGQLQAAAMLRRGKLGEWSKKQVEVLTRLLALVEAGIDFVDQEDVVPIGPGVLDRQLVLLEGSLRELQSGCRSWRELTGLPRVVLVGKASAGKSTLFNALLGRTRAVVDAVPGTTRDILEEVLCLRDGGGSEVEVMLVDAPGEIGGGGDGGGTPRREKGGFGGNHLEGGELILNVVDARDDDVWERKLPGEVVRTKIDLVEGGGGCVSGGVCALTGEGLEALRDAIVDRLGNRVVSVSGEALVLQPRHDRAIRGAIEHVGEGRNLLRDQLDGDGIVHVELVADCLRGALDELGGLGGSVSRDAIIGEVFSTFCVGK